MKSDVPVQGELVAVLTLKSLGVKPDEERELVEGLQTENFVAYQANPMEIHVRRRSSNDTTGERHE